MPIVKVRRANTKSKVLIVTVPLTVRKAMALTAGDYVEIVAVSPKTAKIFRVRS